MEDRPGKYGFISADKAVRTDCDKIKYVSNFILPLNMSTLYNPQSLKIVVKLMHLITYRDAGMLLLLLNL